MSVEMLLDLPEPDAPELPKWTERGVFDLLHARYSVRSQSGERFVRAEHIRSCSGFDAPRTADFMAVDLWRSTQHAIHGHEVKVSRSDWLVELKNPHKAEAFRPYMTYWWLVVSDPKIVKDGELPSGWGLIAVAGNKLRVKVHAPKLDPLPMPLDMTVPLLRAVQTTATRRATPSPEMGVSE